MTNEESRVHHLGYKWYASKNVPFVPVRFGWYSVFHYRYSGFVPVISANGTHGLSWKSSNVSPGVKVEER